MDASAIMATVRSGNVPYQWNVWPLRRGPVLRAAIGWLITGIIGLVLLIAAAASLLPGQLTAGSFAAGATVLLLGLLVAIAGGGLGIGLYDAWRATHVGHYWIVMTPDDYVQTTSRKTTHVPMEYVEGITLNGGSRARSATAPEPPSGLAIFSFGRGPRAARSLAFVDMRTKRVVTVARDDSFEAIEVLEEILAQHAYNKQRLRRS